MQTTILILAGLIFLTLIILTIVLLLRKREVFPEPILQAFQELSSLKEIKQNIQDMAKRMEVDSATQGELKSRLESTKTTVDSLKIAYEERKQLAEETRNTVKKLDHIIAGSYSKGLAGENILAQALKILPPDMVQENIKINGKVVEFGLILADKRILPIDSKWTATSALLEIENENDPEKQVGLARDIENMVKKKIDEVSQYISPDATTSWAVAAIPDSVFSICRTTHFDAYKKHVILMSYSMAIPYLLALYRLCMEYSKSIDLENLQSRLINIERNLDEIDEILENKIAKSGTMINNAYLECKRSLSNIKSSLIYLQAAGEERPLSIEKNENNNHEDTK